jgi:replicative DNA helicase
MTEFDSIPYNEEIEQVVIGSVLIDPTVFPNLASFIKPEDFFLVRHRYIWEALLRLAERGELIERITLNDELMAHTQLDKIGGDAYISTLISSTPTAFYAETYARLIERDAVRRRLLEASDVIKQLALDRQKSVEDVLSESETTLFRISERRQQRDIISMREATNLYFEQLETMMTHHQNGMGIPSGFKKLDALMGGFQRSDLIIFAGRPGMGKTAFLLTVAMNMSSLANANVAIFTLEMGVEQLVQRMIAMETGINMQNLRLGKIDNHEYGRLVEAIGRLSTRKIFIDDSPSLSPLQLRTKCQRLKYEHGLDFVIVDYLQLMNAGGSYENNRVQEISYISRQLKELARELNVPLLSAAQLSRAVEQRADKRPQLSDLRESGSIEQDADIVMFLYREIVYNEAADNPNQADVIIAKHRNGPTDTIPLYFDPTITRFMDGTRQNYDLSAMA